MKQRLVLLQLLLIKKVCNIVRLAYRLIQLLCLGRNSIIVILGANLLLNEDDIKQAEEIIRQSKVVVCQLEIREETVMKTFEIARKHSGEDEN
jgi:hypothetical protein